MMDNFYKAWSKDLEGILIKTGLTLRDTGIMVNNLESEPVFLYLETLSSMECGKMVNLKNLSANRSGKIYLK